MHNDVIPPLPKFTENEIQYFDFEFIVKELSQSQNIFMLYETSSGVKISFDSISDTLYACMVAKLAHPENNKIYQFLKLVLEAVYQEKKLTKKGHEIACQIEKYYANGIIKGRQLILKSQSQSAITK